MQSGVGAQQYRRDVASMRLCDKESQRPWERERWELAKECQERGVRLLRNARNEAPVSFKLIVSFILLSNYEVGLWLGP